MHAWISLRPVPVGRPVVVERTSPPGESPLGALAAVACVTIALLGSALAAGAPILLAQTPAPTGRVAAAVFTATGTVPRPVAHALVRSGRSGAETDSAGVARLVLPAGTQTLTVSRIGYAPDSVQVTVSAGSDTAVTIHLREQGVTIAPVIVTAARGERRLEDEPERVEVLAGEDVDEKTAMRPANPTVLLAEMPGVRVQPTSAALGGAGVRVQGLRGRYTLLLADGLPLYGAASEGLGFLQIPPLDLAQAEVIKGAATALYGPAAAGGVLNLISRRPPGRGSRADGEVLVNQTSQRGTDALLWSAARLSDTWGYTLLGGVHNQVPTDVSGDGWRDVPGFRRGELRPRLFWTGANGSSVMVTAGGAGEHRRSGTTDGALAPDGAPFRVAADTRRGDVGVVAHVVLPRASVLAVRASANRQWQRRELGDSAEADRRGTAFAEATVAHTAGAHQALVGVGVQGDALTGAHLPEAAYHFVTTSLFGQDSYAATRRVSISATARLDRQSRYGTFLSPRVSALARLAPGWAARGSVGTGVFAPTPLVEEADAVGLARVRGFAALEAERLASASFDLTRTMGPLEIDGTLFRSAVAHAVVVRETQPPNVAAPGGGTLTLVNAPTPTHAGGAELFAVYNREPVAVTALYTYTRASEWSADAGHRVDAPLTPRHAAGLDVAFEEDESGTRIGVEVFYTGRQALADDPYRATSVPYTTVGVLAEQRVGAATLFLNADDLTNVRQTRVDPLLLPRRSPSGRWTTDQWAPLEGRVVNAGVRIRL